VRRYEHAVPGEILHIDIKKLGKFNRIGHRIPRRPEQHRRAHLGQHHDRRTGRIDWLRSPSSPIGDQVVYADGPLGAYATARVYPADRLVRIPDGVSDAQAAASFLRGVTARMLLKEVVPLQRDDMVLFHAAAGGVGLLFAQWARTLGVRVIGTVSSAAKAAAARQASCVEVIDYMKEDFVTRVHDLTGGEGVAAVFDSIGRDTFLKSLEVLRPRGALVAFGQASGGPPAFDPFLLAAKALHVTWPGRHIYTASREQLETSAADLFDAIREGILDVGPTRTYAFDDIVLAHRDLESRKIIGAAVIEP
jgi:NADPH2:quinone reductase